MEEKSFYSTKRESYSCQFDITPELTDGMPVTIFTECYREPNQQNDNYYCLEIFFSVNEIGVRNRIINLGIGTKEMDKSQMDAEIEDWVRQIVTNIGFRVYLMTYMKKEELWDNYLGLDNKDADDAK